MTIAALYSALLILLLTVLGLNVSRTRIREKVAFGDGGNRPLQGAQRAHLNALEQIIPLLPMLWIIAWLGGSPWSIHLLGISLFVSRVLHAIGMLQRNFLFRRLGALISFVLGIVMPVWILVLLAMR